MIYAPLVLVVALVLARSSAEGVPDVSNKSDSAGDKQSLADSKGRLRVHDEAAENSNEERVGPQPPKFLASMINEGESSANPLASNLKSNLPSWMKGKSVLSSNVPNKAVSHLKSNIAFTERMEQLDINIDHVAAAVQTLRTSEKTLSSYNDYTLTLMALGNEYFKIVENFGIKMRSIDQLKLKRIMGEYVISGKLKRWMADRKGSRVSFEKVYGKMHWLEEMGDFKMSEKEDLADMAFGSEFFSANKIEVTIPSPIQGGDKIETLDQLKHQIEQLAEQHAVDPKVIEKLRALAEDPGSIGKTKRELLGRARDAALDDEVDYLKKNKAFTQRMGDLEINIDGVKVAVQRLRKQPGLLKYDDYSLYLMALGSEYFQKVEQDGVKIESLSRSFFTIDMIRFTSSSEYKLWAAERKHFLDKIVTKFYGKVRWLLRDDPLKLKDEELAYMAFGSEFFSGNKIEVTIPSPIQGEDKVETLDQIKHQIEQLAEQHAVDPKVIEKLRALAKDPGSIGKTKKELLRRAKDAVLDDEVDYLKRNKAFTQRMKELKINIDSVKVAVQRLRKQPGLLKYDDYDFYLMALGSIFFKKIESDGVNIKPIQKWQFEGDLRADESSELQRWIDERKHTLHGILEKLYGKMRRLKVVEHLNLKDEELANMAFGSEFFKISEHELPLSSPIQDGDKIETLDQLNRLLNQVLNGSNGESNKVKEKMKDNVQEDPRKVIGLTAEQLKRKAIHEALGISLGKETNKKPKVA